jgi:uncharacterized protein
MTIIDFFNEIKGFRSDCVAWTIWFWKKRKFHSSFGRLNDKQPMMIETIDEEEKIPPLLLPLKQMIGDNGFITIHRVQVV